jgi:hypothetical protein
MLGQQFASFFKSVEKTVRCDRISCSAVNVTVMASINVNPAAPSSAANGVGKSWGKPFAVGVVVAIPAAQGGIAGVGKKKLQRRRFNMAVAKNHVGFASRESDERNQDPFGD